MRPPIERVLRFYPDEMARRGRRGAAALHATHDSAALAAVARRAFEARFDNEVDPQRLLPEDERRRRAALARKAYFRQLGQASAAARRARKAEGVRP